MKTRAQRTSRLRRHQRKCKLQQLNQRILLAADSIEPNQSASLIAAFDSLDDFGDRLNLSQPLSTFVPLAEVQGQTTEATIGEQLDVGQILATAVATPATTYLESSPNPTATGLANAIRDAEFQINADPAHNLQLQAVVVTESSDDDKTQFEIAFVAKRQRQIEIDFAKQLPDAAAQINGVFTGPLDLQFNFSTTITVQRSDDALPETTFAFDTSNSVSARFAHDQQDELEGTLGFLSFDVQNATANYDLFVGLDFDAVASAPIAASDLSSQPLDSILEFSLPPEPANRFLADLPLIVQTNGLDLGANPADPDKPRIIIEDTDLFDGEFDNREPFFQVQNASNLADFKTVTAVGIYTALQTVQDVFVSVQQSDAFQKEIPLTDGKTLADILDVGAAFGEKLIGPMGLSSQATSSNQEDTTSSGNDDPAFRSVQDLVNKLASKISYSPDDDGDSSTHDPVITFDVDFHHLFEVLSFDASIDFPLDAVNGIQTDSTIDVEAELDTAFQVGVLLRRAEGGLPLSPETRIGDLNGGEGVDFSTGSLDLTLRNGLPVSVDLSTLTADHTLQNLIEVIQDGVQFTQIEPDDFTEAAQTAISEDSLFRFVPDSVIRSEGVPAGLLRVLISEDGDALEIIDSTHIDILGGDLTPGTLSVADGELAAALGLSNGRTNDDTIAGRPINGRFALNDDTPLSDLNRGRGIETVAPAVPTDPGLDDLKITAANGASFTVNLSDLETVGEVIAAIVTAASTATDPESGGAVDLTANDEFDVTFSSDYTGLTILDRTEGTGELRVSSENESLAVVGLGIAGIGQHDEEAGVRRIEGVPLHGRTISDNVFIRQVAAASGPASLVTPGVDAIQVGREVTAQGQNALTDGTERVNVEAGTDLSGVFPGDRLLLTVGNQTTTHEVISVNDRADTIDVAKPIAVGDFQWETHRDVNLSRVVSGDQIILHGRTDGIDGSNVFDVVFADNVNDTILVQPVPSDTTSTTAWEIDRLAPMLSGTGRLIGNDIDATAMLGFVGINVENGKAVGQLTANISLGDTGTDAFDDRVTLGEAFDGLRNVGLKISGRNEITFPQTQSEVYGGVLKLTIDEPTDDGTNQTVIPVPFFVPPMPPPNSSDDDAESETETEGNNQSTEPADEDPLNLRARAIATQLTLSMLAVEAVTNIRAEIADGVIELADLRQAIDDIQTPRIKLGTSGDRLTFTFADGVARPLTASAGQLTDLTDAIGLADDDVRLIIKLLANIPGSGISRDTELNELNDSEAAVFKLGVTADPGRIRFANKPQLQQDYEGKLKLTALNGENPSTVIETSLIQVTAQTTTTAQLIESLTTAINSDQVAVSDSSGRLVLRRADGDSMPLVVEAFDANSEEFLAKLGFDLAAQSGVPSAYVAAPELIGAGELTLPVDIQLDLPGLTLPAGLPEIHVGIPDLSLDNFSLPGALNVDLGELGDIASLRDLSLSSIIRAMQAGLRFLEGLDGFDELPLLNADLPLVDINLRDILNIADAFGDIIVQLELNPVAGLGLVEEFLEDALGMPEDKEGEAGKPDFPVFTIPELNEGLPEFGGIDLADSIAYLSDPDADLAQYPDLESYLLSLQGGDAGNVELSFDRDGSDLAVRIDIGMELAQIRREANLNLDLESLGIQGVNNLVPNAGGHVDVNAGAFVGLSLGLDLTHEDGVKPFLYDMQGTGAAITGTRIEILADAHADDLDFAATVGPLGVEIANGSLDIQGPIDIDPATNRGKAKLAVGLGTLFSDVIFGFDPESGDGRHYLDEIFRRGDTIKIASGSRAEVTENDSRIQLPRSTDLSQVNPGDKLLIGNETLVIRGVSSADAVVIVENPLPSVSIAAAKWEISRDTEVANGPVAIAAENTHTVRLPVSVNLGHVLVGDTFSLIAPEENGSDESATIASIDLVTNTLTLDSLIETADGTYEWAITRLGDFEFLLDITDLQIDVTGSASANLPVSLPSLAGLADGEISVNIGDFQDLTSINIDADGIFGDALDILRGNFNLSAMVGGWNTAFGYLTDAMRGQVFGLNIPLIGNALQDQADFLDRMNQSVVSNLESNEENGSNDSQGVKQALYDALGPGGLNWLKDLDTPGNIGAPSPDGAITIDDIVVRPEIDAGNPGFIFDFQVGQDLIDLSIPGGFDLGIPGLDFDLNAPVDAKLGFDMRITMGLNLRDGFFIQTGPNGSVPEIQVYLDVAVPGLAASGELAYLKIDARDLPTPQATLGSGDAQLIVVAKEPKQALQGVKVIIKDAVTAGNETVQFDATNKELIIQVEAGVTTAEAIVALINSQPDSSEVGKNFRAEVPLGTRGRQPVTEDTETTVADRASGFRGVFGVDIVDPNNDDGKITTGEMLRVSGLDEVVEVQLNGVADLNFALNVDMKGIDFFPSLRTNFGLDWNIGLDVGVPKPIVQFTDVQMNLGQFFGDFVGPILGQAQDILGPIQPVIDVLAGPLPVISDLAGMDISAIDLAKLYGGGTAKVAGFLDGVAKLVTIINALPKDIANSEWLNFGGFRFDVDVNRIVEVFGPAKAIFDAIREVASTFDPSELTGEDGHDDEYHLDFPVLTNPKLLFDLMLGKDVDLFTLELPTFEFDANIRQFYPIPAFPVLGAELRGSIGAEIDLAFGYDTTGLRRYFNTGSKTSVADGFFLFDHENADGSGDDIPELTVSAGISAGPAVQLALASVTVQGGVFADIFFDLHDNNEDGKIRGLELLDNALLDNSLIHIFDVNGVLDARLFASLEIGTGIFKVSKSFSLAEVELLNYNFPRPDGNTVPLAELQGSTLNLNIGPRAALRNNPVIDFLDPDHDEDNNEHITINAGDEPGSVVVSMLGREQTYRGVTRIKGDAGLGDDKITIGENVTIPVAIYGGPGADDIQGGSGADRIVGGKSDDPYYVGMPEAQVADGRNILDGGAGNDVLIGGIFADHLRGADGNDQIRGGDGADLLEGGEGNDDIDGQAGDDVIMGGGGSDELRGGDGNDLVEGETGADKILGGGGNDRLLGGRDSDWIDGESGQDSILGDEGADVLYGGTGSDLVYGGVGNDTIFGGKGDDQLFGENSRDTIYGDEGNDIIVGGLAGDDLFGGLGDDKIYSTDLQNSDDNASHLIHGGGGNDLIYAGILSDQIFGDGENDSTGTRDPSTDGDDLIFAFAGDDSIDAGGGNDQIHGGLGADDIWGGIGNDLLYATDNLDSPDPGNSRGATMVGGPGDDVIRAQPGAGLQLDDTIFGDGPISLGGVSDPITDGDDVIFAFQGNDVIDAGHGHNIVFSGDGNDTVTTGDGVDIINAGDGNDWVVAGLGDDQIIGGAGNDVLFGGLPIGTAADFNLADQNNFTLPPEYAAREQAYPTGYSGPAVGTATHFIYPAFLTGSVFGTTGDGRDKIMAGDGIDFVFGGADVDTLDGGGGADFIDAGGGSDLDVNGGGGDDIVIGGIGDDVLQGGEGIDQVYGNLGDDLVFGEPSGSSQTILLGQRLYGNDGRDQLFAFAPDNATPDAGEQLFGGDDGDFLRGNLLSEVLVGGNGNDYIHGDILAGSQFFTNSSADLIGGNDLILGGSGEDQLFGGGGDDEIWGGAGTDIIEGQAGSDIQYGGSEIDLFVAPSGFGQSSATSLDVVDGHYGNMEFDDVVDDNATDILVINGTGNDDTILLSQTTTKELHVSHPNGDFNVQWLDSSGNPLVEQFQIAGLGGHDKLGFATDASVPGLSDFQVPGGHEPLDLSVLQSRSRDFIGVFDGNSGNDTLVGNVGRDRLDGGRGSDILMGFGGDDRLWGDSGEGVAVDHDVLFAGTGNDDLIGGSGRNTLYAWSYAPDSSLAPTGGDAFDPGDVQAFMTNGASGAFGVFTTQSDGSTQLEVTGLNRIVGNSRDDYMFGGTALDFLFGNGGDDTLFRSDGTTFSSLDGGLAGDQWKEYARQSDQVWYVGGTNAKDEIHVDFVTEPGVLADHHLITRLTDNNGNVSFSAQVRLDFEATDAQGNRVWDPNDVVIDAAERLATLDTLQAAGEVDEQERAALLGDVQHATTQLNNSLLPSEGDFLAIVVDALDGNDEIIIGPTVQKSVWIDAGDGDDRVEIRGGNPILVDRAEQSHSDAGLKGRNDSANYSYELLTVQDGLLQTSNGKAALDGAVISGLSIDNPQDEDWFAFELATDISDNSEAEIQLASGSPIDELKLELFEAESLTGELTSVNAGSFQSTGDRGSISLAGLSAGSKYRLRVWSPQLVPTPYDVRFDLLGEATESEFNAMPQVDLSISAQTVRRDVIIGGKGDDILRGGAGEDFIFGGEGDDVLSGGKDRNASDVIFAGPGNDTFQIIPDALPLLGNQANTQFDPATSTYLPTFNDQLRGDEGDDRVLFLGGDLDRTGVPVPDYVSIRYNTGLHRYEFTSLVWDIANQEFVVDPATSMYEQHYMFFQAKDVEYTQIVTQDGDDVVHADPEFRFLPLDLTADPIEIDSAIDPSLYSTWGIDVGDRQQRAEIASLDIRGGDGNDHLFGGSEADRIDGEAGNDIIVGAGGNDLLRGGLGDDQIIGFTSDTVSTAYPYIHSGVNSDRELFDYELVTPKLFQRDSTAANNQLETDILEDAPSLSGATPDERLASVRSIGDFDGDGFEDFVVQGSHRSFILLRPLSLIGNQNIEEFAEIVVDHNSIGVPVDGVGDVNNDGINDLTFAFSDNKTTITTVYGANDIAWPRFWGNDFTESTTFANNATQFEFTAGQLATENVSGSYLNHDGDGSADVLITSTTTNGTLARSVVNDGNNTNVFKKVSDANVEIDGKLYFSTGSSIVTVNTFGTLEQVDAIESESRLVQVGTRRYHARHDKIIYHDEATGAESSIGVWEDEATPRIFIDPSTLSVDVKNELLYFSAEADHENDNYYLYRWDPANDATLESGLTRIRLDNDSSPNHLTHLPEYFNGDDNAPLYFVQQTNNASEPEIYRLSGNEAVSLGLSTFAADDPSDNITSIDSIGEMITLDGELYFVANIGSIGNELWHYDPSHGFSIAAQISGSAGLDPSGMTVFDGSIYFESFGDLYRFNPDSGLTQVTNSNVDGVSSPSNITEHGGSLFFTAQGPSTGGSHVLWRYDGDSTVNIDPVALDETKGLVSGGGNLIGVENASGDLVRYGNGNVGYVVSGESIASNLVTSIAIQGDGSVFPETGGFQAQVLGDVNGDELDDIAFQDPDFAPVSGTPATVSAFGPANIDVFSGPNPDFNVTLNIQLVDNTATPPVSSRFITLTDHSHPNISSIDDLVDQINLEIADTDLQGKVFAKKDITGTKVDFTTTQTGDAITLRVEETGDIRDLIGYRTELPAVHSSPYSPPAENVKLRITTYYGPDDANVGNVWIDAGWSLSTAVQEISEEIDDSQDGLASARVFVDENGHLAFRTSQGGPDTIIHVAINNDANHSFTFPDHPDRDACESDRAHCLHHGSSRLAKEADGTNDIDGSKFGYFGIHRSDTNNLQSPITLVTDTENTFGFDIANNVTPLGDINGDSVADWAISLGSSSGSTVEINLGTPNPANVLTMTIVDSMPTLDAPTITSGDWNHDGEVDLAFSFAGENETANRVVLIEDFRDLIGMNTQLLLSDIATRQLHSDYTFPSSPALSALDLNGDGYDDLAVGLPLNASEFGSDQLPSGTIHVISGSPNPIKLPTESVVSLSTISVPGSGEYLVDRGTGRPAVFSDNGNTFVAQPGASTWMQFATLGDGKAGQNIRIDSDQNIVGQLFDDRGIAASVPSSILDLRALPAGDYFLRVENTDSSAGEFLVSINAPIRGQTHASTLLPDRDRIEGNGGNDILIGNFDIDALLGGSGADTFYGESIEIRDPEIVDTQNAPQFVEEQITVTTPTHADPLIEADAVWGEFFPVVNGKIRASTLAQIEELDVSNATSPIDSIDILKHATNLRVLVLADQSLDNSDLESLIPHVPTSGQFAGQTLGTPNLQLLDVSGNASVTALLAVQNLTSLRSLNLEGTGVPVNDAATLSSLGQLLHLSELRLPVLGIDHANLAISEGQIASIPLESDGEWTVADLLGNVVAGSTMSLSHGTAETAASVTAVDPAPIAGRVSAFATDIDFSVTLTGSTFEVSLPNSPYFPAQIVGGSGPLTFSDEYSIDFDNGTSDAQAVFNIDGSNLTVAETVSLFNIEIDASPLAGHVIASETATGAFSIATKAVGSEVSLFMGANNGTGMQDLGIAVANSSLTVFGSDANSTVNNTSVDDLVDDLNDALTSAGANGAINASNESGHIKLSASAPGANTSLVVDYGNLDQFGFTPNLSTIQFSANDNGVFLVNAPSATSPASFPVLVGNLAPTIAPASLPSELPEGVELSVSIEGTDNLNIDVGFLSHNGDLIQETIVASDPALYQSDLLNAEISITSPDLEVHQLIGDTTTAALFLLDQEGTYRLSIRVSDKDGATTTLEKTFDVVNVAPVALHDGPDGIIQMPVESSLVLSGDRSFDPGNDQLTYHWEVTSEHGVPTPSVDSPTLEFNPAHTGQYSATLTVTDDGGLASSVTKVIEVLPTAVIEVADWRSESEISDVTTGQTLLVSANDGFRSRISAIDSGAVRSYQWTVMDQSGTTVATGQETELAFVVMSGGTHTVSLTVTDTFGSGAESVALENTIVETFDANNRQTEITTPSAPFAEGDTIPLAVDGLAKIDDFDPTAEREFHWVVRDASDTVIAFNQDALFAFVPHDNGTYTIQSTVTDIVNGMENYHFATATLQVDNVAPSIARTESFVFFADNFQDEPEFTGFFDPSVSTTTAAIGYEGMVLSLPLAITDPGADFYNGDWEIRDSSDSVVASGSDTYIEFSPADNGDFTAEVTIADDDGGESTFSFPIEIRNLAPNVDAGPNQVLLENETGSSVTFAGSFTDLGINDGPHQIVWDFGDGQTLVDNEGTATSPVHEYQNSGTYNVRMTVTDKDGAVSVDELTVQIVNQKPTVESLASVGTNHNAGDIVTIAGVITDHAADGLRATLSFGDGHEIPIVLEAIDDAGHVRRYAFELLHTYRQAGTFYPTLTVRDQDGELVEVRGVAISVAANNAPTDISLSENTLPENIIGPVVGNLSINDPDSGNTHTFEVSDDRFEVQNGALRLKSGVAIRYSDGAQITLDITATDSGTPPLSITKSFVIDVEENMAFQNSAEPTDTNNDGGTTSLDALEIINQLADAVANGLPQATTPSIDKFWDVNGDGRISALDALIVINSLATSSIEDEEGELLTCIPAEKSETAMSGAHELHATDQQEQNAKRIDQAHETYLKGPIEGPNMLAPNLEVESELLNTIDLLGSDIADANDLSQ